MIFRLTGHCSLDNDGVGGLSRHCEVHNAQQRSPLPATSSHWQRNTSPLPATSSHEQRRTADPHPQQQKTGRISCARPHLTILFILSLCFGSSTVNVEPAPSTLFTYIFPSWDSTRCLTMARPSPVPPEWRLRALSTR